MGLYSEDLLSEGFLRVRFFLGGWGGGRAYVRETRAYFIYLFIYLFFGGVGGREGLIIGILRYCLRRKMVFNDKTRPLFLKFN